LISPQENSKQKSKRLPLRFGLEKSFDQAATSLQRGCTTLRAPFPLDFWLRMKVTYGLDNFKPWRAANATGLGPGTVENLSSIAQSSSIERMRRLINFIFTALISYVVPLRTSISLFSIAGMARR
jgi:hypothetical protein